jgi:glycosyltransferase involved in cell wall biosynthesis
MKLLYFTQLFYPAIFGGGEYIFYQWAKQMVKTGHQVYVITQNLCGKNQRENNDGIEIFRVGAALSVSGTLPTNIVQNISFLLGSYRIGNKIIKEQKIDLIHSNTYMPTISAQWCARKAKIPHIATVHDVYYTSKNNFWKGWSLQKHASKLTKFLGPYIEKKIAKTDVTLFHTVSEQSKIDLQSLGVTKKIVVIPNGIDPTPYSGNITKKQLQAIYVGRLVFYKNIDVIIEAFAIIIKKIPTAKLLIVGDGPMKNSISEKIKGMGLENNIQLCGNVTEEQKIKLIQESTMLLNPSLIEGFGIVVLEAFAAGKPVLVSDTKPLSDLVTDSVDGFVLKSDDPQAWASTITNLFNDDSLAEKLGLAGRQKVKKYTISNLVNDLTAMYESVLK